jgi:type II secretory pathway component PulK
MKFDASSIISTHPVRIAAQRRGAASIVAIAVLVILAGIMAQQVRRVLMERRQMRNEVAYLQTEKLADAGLLLAQKSKSKDPAWLGLTWNLPPGSIHQTNSAEVVITVQDDSCTVVARYPANAEIPFQVTRTRKLAP